jgi:hypothetical protein
MPPSQLHRPHSYGWQTAEAGCTHREDHLLRGLIKADAVAKPAIALPVIEWAGLCMQHNVHERQPKRRLHAEHGGGWYDCNIDETFLQ